MGCPFEIPFPLGPVHLVHHKGELLTKKKKKEALQLRKGPSGDRRIFMCTHFESVYREMRKLKLGDISVAREMFFDDFKPFFYYFPEKEIVS